MTESTHAPAPTHALPNSPARTPRRPSDNEVRMRRLLVGGAVTGHAAALGAVGVCLVTRGAAGALSCALAAVGVLVFFTLGHAVQLRLADAEPKRILFGAIASYALRVGALAALLGFFLANEASLTWVDRIALFVGAAAAVFGWLAGEIVTFTRLRIPAYDTPVDVRNGDVPDDESAC